MGWEGAQFPYYYFNLKEPLAPFLLLKIRYFHIFMRLWLSRKALLSCPQKAKRGNTARSCQVPDPAFARAQGKRSGLALRKKRDGRIRRFGESGPCLARRVKSRRAPCGNQRMHASAIRMLAASHRFQAAGHFASRFILPPRPLDVRIPSVNPLNHKSKIWKV